jgi:hypothetical protein
MSTRFPVGWGFHDTPKEEFDRVSAQRRNHDERAERMRRQTAAARTAENRKKAIAARRATYRGQDRCMHFEFALWTAGYAIAHDAQPSASAVRDRFGVSLTTAYAFLADIKKAANRLQEKP